MRMYWIYHLLRLAFLNSVYLFLFIYTDTFLLLFISIHYFLHFCFLSSLFLDANTFLSLSTAMHYSFSCFLLFFLISFMISLIYFNSLVTFFVFCFLCLFPSFLFASLSIKMQYLFSSLFFIYFSHLLSFFSVSCVYSRHLSFLPFLSIEITMSPTIIFFSSLKPTLFTIPTTLATWITLHNITKQ